MAKESKKGKEQELEVRREEPAYLTPFEEMERLFESFFPMTRRPLWGHWPDLGEMSRRLEQRVPKVDVIDRENEVLVRAEAPGVSKDNLDISLSGNTVTIKGAVKHELKREEGDYHRREMSTSSFARTVSLPCSVDESKARATFEDGILELTLPKSEAARRHRIEVE